MLAGECHDLLERRTSVCARRLQHVQRHRLVDREACDARRPLARGPQRDGAAIGMTDEMDRPFRRIDDVDDPCRFVGCREGTSCRSSGAAAPQPIRSGAISWKR